MFGSCFPTKALFIYLFLNLGGEILVTPVSILWLLPTVYLGVAPSCTQGYTVLGIELNPCTICHAPSCKNLIPTPEVDVSFPPVLLQTGSLSLSECRLFLLHLQVVIGSHHWKLRWSENSGNLTYIKMDQNCLYCY